MSSKLNEISDKYWDGNDDELTTALENAVDTDQVDLNDGKKVSALIIYLSEYLEMDQQKDMKEYFTESVKDWETK